ncbi:MAG: cellobiose phosphorylase [Endomicrobia bacterium]|nr:cellobiose phosphorylase [Endomicrobiia bacterium]MCL2507272.1 cellobiose phosphorylase [Endomicrobiia bacterium]
MNNKKANYFLQDDGAFVIENYNNAPAFSSFFPGIAGLKGIPLWAFYVNRGQGIASFGIKNKNYSIMEFYPANTSYSLVSTFGFRTFLKIKKGKKVINYEAFAVNPSYDVKQTMYITSCDMAIEEINETLGIKTTVRYATLPNEPIAAIIRAVSVENISKENIEIEIADGMPKLIPYYVNQWAQKFMSTTIQAWTTIDNFEKTGNPFFRLKVDTADSAEVVEINEGNFYFGYSSNGKKIKKAEVVINPDVLFGSDLSFEYPKEFFSNDKNFKYPKSQFAENRYPCAFGYSSEKLNSKQSFTFYSMAGHIDSTDSLNSFVKKAGSAKYFEDKIEENKKLIINITENVTTKSSFVNFDNYCKQMYLDNVLRGGYPITFEDSGKKTSYYVYSRKHGDLERDYNDFQLSPNYYSQGNGNFRDINQNRRKDIFFNPEIGSNALKYFYNLIQIDGNNPLVVKGAYFVMDTGKPYYKDIAAQIEDKAGKAKLEKFFAKGFEPGQLAMFLLKEKIKTKIKLEDFVAKCVTSALEVNDAEHGEGFWVDHWTYNQDLLDSFLAIYPEKENELLFKDKSFIYFDCNHYVVPRDQKHVLFEGKVRRYGAVAKSNEKDALIKSRKVNPNALRTENGKGEVYKNTLASKFLAMITIKMSTLDPDGIGIEMESDKPGWYDSLNGLPGIFGSSTCETFELKRFAMYFKDVLSKNPGEKISLPSETAELLSEISKLLKSKISSFDFWNKASEIKEKYRESVVMGIKGSEKTFSSKEVIEFLENVLKKINEGLKKAVDVKTGLYYTYFKYEAVKYKQINSKNIKGLPCVRIDSFKRFPLPLFLEGEVHYMRSETDKEKVLKHIQNMRNSGVYDKKLKMFKVNESLNSESLEIGRTRVFNRGWLENESVFLHMAYKYLLEILKAGLYDEFFKEIKTGFVCFTDPKIYKRSILENSSFICSSAFPDADNHGRGFIARLSGSTVEFIDMWLRMTVGAKPFSYKNGELCFELKPVINSAFFDKSGNFSFKLFSNTEVTYINPSKKSTYSKDAEIKKIEIVWNNGKKQIVDGKVIKGSDASKIREVQAKSLKVYF